LDLPVSLFSIDYYRDTFEEIEQFHGALPERVLMICKMPKTMRSFYKDGRVTGSIITARVIDIIDQGPDSNLKIGDSVQILCDFHVRDDSKGIKTFFINIYVVPIKGEAYYLIYARKYTDTEKPEYGYYYLFDPKYCVQILYQDDTDMQNDKIKHAEGYPAIREQILEKYKDRIEAARPKE